MTTIKPTYTTDKINKILKKYREVTFAKGTYNLTGILNIYSNTTIICEEGAVFRRCHNLRLMEFVYSAKTTKYGGTHDVIWKGGTFVCDLTSPGSLGMVMCHSKNITISDVTFAGCNGAHCIEINSSKNVKILNCTFKNHIPENGKTTKEAIQIDFAYFDGLAITGADGNSPVYDGTHCSDIIVDGCIFDRCVNGIGTHTICELERYHTNIKITNCKFTNIQIAAIKVLSMKDVQIFNCDAECIQVNKTQTAHKVSGGKIKLAMDRHSANVKIDNVTIS